MFRGLLSLIAVGSVIAHVNGAEAPAEFYINRTPVTNAQVNARNFVNEGTFLVDGTVPWDSQNTLTFTNRGTISGGIGFRFENVEAPFGIRRPANVFYNSPAGYIEAADSSTGFFIFGDEGGVGGVSFLLSASSLLKVNAVNLTNRGVITVGANGFIQIHGGNVDLTAGSLIVGDLNDPLSGGGGSGFPSGETNFFPASGIYDLAWGISSSTNTSVQGVIQGVNPNVISTPVPPPTVTNAFSGGFFQTGCIGDILLDEALVWIREEVIDETNEVVQLVAVQVSDPSIGVFTSFAPITFPVDNPLGGYLTPIVELRVGSTDFKTLTRVTNSLYIADQLGTHTNRSLMENVLDGTFRPGNFVVFRGFPDFFGGQPSSTNLRQDLLTAHLAPDAEYLNNVVSNDWAIYSAEVASVPTRLPSIPGVAITNLGGQVEINAKQLKLANTRIRGEGFVSLTASNVVTGPNVVVDVPRLTVNFGTGGESLNVNEFVPDFVERFSGYLQAYGTIFTNTYETYTTNAPTDPADTNSAIVTNVVEVRFQLTIVDGRQLQTTEPTVVQDLKLTSTNGASTLTFNENLTITNFIGINAKEVTFSEGSRIYAPSGVGFSYTNFQNIRTFTNLGTIQFNELADLRQSESVPYESFVNRGELIAFGAEIWADYFENTGNIISSNFTTFSFGGRNCFGVPSVFQIGEFTEGNINIRSSTLNIGSGSFTTLGDIRLFGENVALSNWTAVAAARLVLDVGQTLTDGGTNAPNSITVVGGVEMSSRRPSGSLLGSAIFSFARTLEFVDHIWSAEDRGANAAGFNNNLAIGRLVLEGDRFSVFQFQPSRENSALYVDVLEINGEHAESLNALTNGMILGMNVYYSDVATTSTNGVITAEALNRVFGPDAPFNFIWVPEFVGPNSGADITLGRNGPAARMNRALRKSMTADSDSDGIPNALDPYPLTAAAAGEASEVQLVNLSRNSADGSITFDFGANPTAQYVIEYTTNLVNPSWQAVTGKLTSGELSGLKSFSDKIPQGSSQGYYRVRSAP